MADRGCDETVDCFFHQQLLQTKLDLNSPQSQFAGELPCLRFNDRNPVACGPRWLWTIATARGCFRDVDAVTIGQAGSIFSSDD